MVEWLEMLSYGAEGCRVKNLHFTTVILSQVRATQIINQVFAWKFAFWQVSMTVFLESRERHLIEWKHV